jgi:hypothetical protein
MGNVANPINTTGAVRALVKAIGGNNIAKAAAVFKTDKSDLIQMVKGTAKGPTVARLTRWSKASVKETGIGIELTVSPVGKLSWKIIQRTMT